MSPKLDQNMFSFYFSLVMGDLLPFETDVKDSILRINSDEVSNSPINLTSPIVFYLEQRTSLYVRNSILELSPKNMWLGEREASPTQ